MTKPLIISTTPMSAIPPLFDTVSFTERCSTVDRYPTINSNYSVRFTCCPPNIANFCNSRYLYPATKDPDLFCSLVVAVPLDLGMQVYERWSNYNSNGKTLSPSSTTTNQFLSPPLDMRLFFNTVPAGHKLRPPCCGDGKIIAFVYKYPNWYCPHRDGCTDIMDLFISQSLAAMYL